MADDSNRGDPNEQLVQEKSSSKISNQEIEKRKRQDGRPNSAPESGGTAGSQRQELPGLSPSTSERTIGAAAGSAGTGAAGGSGGTGVSLQWGPKKSVGSTPARVRAETIRNTQRARLQSVVAMESFKEQEQAMGRQRGESQGYTWTSKHSGSRGLLRRSRQQKQQKQQQQALQRRSAMERQRLGAPEQRRLAAMMDEPSSPDMESDSDDEDATLQDLRNRQRVRVGHLRRISSDSNQWNMLKNYLMAMNMKTSILQPQVFEPEEHEVKRFWDIKLSEEDTRFFEAVRHNDVDAINAALAAGADPTSRNEDGYTAIHVAVEVDALSALHTLLLAGNVPVSATDTQGVTPLHLAVEMGKRLLVNSLIMAGASINAVDRFGRNPLHYAILGGKVRIVKLLLYCGADPNMADSYGTTPLSMAVLTRPFPDIARTLLVAGALVDVPSGAGFYLLSEAVLACYTETHLDAIRVLLDSGAEVNRQEEVSGQTALHLAALSDNGAVAEVLIYAGADPSITNYSGETAIEMALLHGSRDVLTVLTNLAAAEEMDMFYDDNQYDLRNVMGSVFSELGLTRGSDSDTGSDGPLPGQPRRQHGRSGVIHSVVLQSSPIVSTQKAEMAALEQTLNTAKAEEPKARFHKPDIVEGGIAFLQKYR